MAETLTRRSMQITDKQAGGGCIPGGIKDAVSGVAQQLVNPDSAAAVCDPLFRKSLHAELVERTSTIFVPFRSDDQANLGGNLILTPTTFAGQLVPLEWFKNGIQYPKAAQDPLATSIAPTVGQLLPGEACPWPLTFADTDAITQSTPPSNSYDFDADLVTEENQDFAAFGLSIEYAGMWTAEGGDPVGSVRRVQKEFAYAGEASYEERILKAIYQNVAIRMQFVEGGDTRLYRLGAPISWPSYSGYFSNDRALTNGQPTMFMFKDLFFGLQMNKRPRLTGNSRVRLFADLPSELNVINNASVPVPQNLSVINGNNGVRGYVWVALRARLFGSAMCIDQSTGQSTEVAAGNLQSIIDRAVREALAKSGR